MLNKKIKENKYKKTVDLVGKECFPHLVLFICFPYIIS